MVLHYYLYHNNRKDTPLALLKKSKNEFDVGVSYPQNRKTANVHTKVVNLDPELQMIIDYKNSLVHASQFRVEKSRTEPKPKNSSNLQKKLISRRIYGNLTAFGGANAEPSSDLEIYDEESESNTNTNQQAADNDLHRKTAAINLKQRDDAPTDSDLAAELQLSKRDLDSAPAFAREASTDANEQLKQVKQEPQRATNKRVSRCCSNLV